LPFLQVLRNSADILSLLRNRSSLVLALAVLQNIPHDRYR